MILQEEDKNDIDVVHQSRLLVIFYYITGFYNGRQSKNEYLINQ